MGVENQTENKMENYGAYRVLLVSQKQGTPIYTPSTLSLKHTRYTDLWDFASLEPWSTQSAPEILACC